MKREVIIICVLAGLLLGLGAVWYQDRTALAEAKGSVVDFGLTWRGRVYWSDQPMNPMVIVNYQLTFEADEGDFTRIRRDTPKLFLEDADGGRVAVRSYRVVDGALQINDVAGLRRAWYTALIALYDGGEQEITLIDLDTRTLP